MKKVIFIVEWGIGKSIRIIPLAPLNQGGISQFYYKK
jgi:hypothetical protein